jgi:hypothetical protein
MIGYHRSLGIFAREKPVRDLLDRLEALAPRWTAA